MGRGKPVTEDEPRQRQELDSVAPNVCVICADEVERKEEFLRGKEFRRNCLQEFRGLLPVSSFWRYCARVLRISQKDVDALCAGSLTCCLNVSNALRPRGPVAGAHPPGAHPPGCPILQFTATSVMSA